MGKAFRTMFKDLHSKTDVVVKYLPIFKNLLSNTGEVVSSIGLIFFKCMVIYIALDHANCDLSYISLI